MEKWGRSAHKIVGVVVGVGKSTIKFLLS
jgi:hypothetical protein